MRKRWGALTILGALSVGLGLGARPAAAGGAGCPTCAHAAAANLIPMGHGHEKLPVWEDESPLYPQLAWWTFERSQCKQGHPFKGGGIHQRSAYAANEPVSFPPLPYSPLAGRVYPQNPSGVMPPHGVAPAPAAAPAPAQPGAAVAPPPEAPADAAKPATPNEANPPVRRRPAASPFEPTRGRSAPPPPTGFPVD